MFSRKSIIIIALALLMAGVSTVTIIWACGGSPRPACAQAAWLAKIVTGVVVVPPAATSADVDITLIPNVVWTQSVLCPTPTFAEIVLTVTVPGLAPQMFTVPTPIPTVQGVQPAIMTTLTVMLPAAGPPVIAAVAGEYRVTFAGGSSGAGTVIGMGDTEICFVEPSPADDSLPRLDMELFTPVDEPYQRCQRGDITHNWYVISNNDPEDSVELTVTSSANQIARIPGGTAPGVFSVSSNIPGTDNFPQSFGDDPVREGDPMDPNDPINQPISLPTFVLDPYGVVIIKVNTAIHGMCADGSCSELSTKALGNWILPDGSTEPALACAGSALIVDNTAPAKLPLCDIIDSVKSGPAQQCAWETASFDNDPLLMTLPGRDDPNVVLDDFITPGQNPPLLSSLTAPPSAFSAIPQQAQDIIRLPESPHSVSYVMDCSRLEQPFQQIRNFVTIHGLDNLPPDQPFDVPFFFLTNGNSTFNWRFEIEIPEDLGRENPTIRWFAGDNEVHFGDFQVFCETPPDAVLGCDFETCRTFTKFFPSALGGDPTVELAVNPSEAVALLPNGAQGPLFDVFNRSTGDPLSWSATSLNAFFAPAPPSTLVPGTALEVVIDSDNIPMAPGLAVAKVVVSNPSTFNGQETILIASRVLPPPAEDSDGDGVSDDKDNAVCVFNPNQRDTDNDGIGNVIDPDLDNDGVVGVADFNIFRAAFGATTGDPNFNDAADLDGDGSVGIADFNTVRALFTQSIDRFSLCPEP